jgi:NADPH2:quinone reductase
MKNIFTTYFPNSMKGLVLKKFDEGLAIEELEVPKPAKGEVLVKIDSAPINPSDWAFLRGLYASPKKLPVVAGFEGSGVVMATGNDFFSRRLLGKKVACFAPPTGNGTWAEYTLTQAATAIPLKKDLSLEQGSMLLVNPLSVIAMISIAKKKRSHAIANTAAASALGQLLDKMCRQNGLQCINIVRRPEQVELLKKNGTQFILDSSSPNFNTEMRNLFKQLNVKIAFDALSGAIVSQLLAALPKGGEVMVYGALSEQEMMVPHGRFIFEGKKISGFWLSQWINQQSMFTLLQAFNKIQKFLGTQHEIQIRDRMSLTQVIEGLNTFPENMSAGKILVKPWPL